MKTKEQAIILKKVSKEYQILSKRPTIVERIIFRKQREYFPALNNISLTIGSGETVGIIGPNGAGKTTLFNIVSGITVPTRGNV